MLNHSGFTGDFDFDNPTLLTYDISKRWFINEFYYPKADEPTL